MSFSCRNSNLSVSANEFVPRSGPRNTSQWAAATVPAGHGPGGPQAQGPYDYDEGASAFSAAEEVLEKVN